MKKDKSNVLDLLDKVSKKFMDNNPTLLDMVGKGTSETVHSAIIAYLLDPKTHEAGSECLKEFVNLFPDNALGRFNPDNVIKVQVEKDLGPVLINERPTGGRLDIFLEDAEGNVVVIENKLYAADSECQLLRYHNSLVDLNKPHTLIYLTLQGNNPTEWSLGSQNFDIKTPLKVDNVIRLSYSAIQRWLLKIQDYCSPMMKSNIEQYSQLLTNLFMENQISQEILSSGNHYRAAIQVAKNLEEARMNLKREFMASLKINLTNLLRREENYLFEHYSNPGNSKLIGLTICSQRYGLRYNVVIDWRLYITCNHSFPEILQRETWDYIGGMDAYNFHNCSDLVAEYLSSQENKQLIVNCAAKQIIEIIYRIEGKI